MKKIAFATDDGETISAHLGRAQYFQVVTLDDAGGMDYEQRSKPHHGAEEAASPQEHAGHQVGQAILAAIVDCQVLIAGGMGEPVYQRALAQGLEIIMPAEKRIQAALDAYRKGSLVSDIRRIHHH